MSPLNQNEIPLSSEIWLDAKQLDRNRSTWAVTKIQLKFDRTQT